MGGKSSSSSSQSSSTTTTNETLQAESSGVLTGNLYQGKDLTINDQFSPEVQKAFGSLVDLAEGAGGSAFDLAKLSINSITGVFEDLTNLSKQNTDKALTEISAKTTQRENPQQATINSILPLAMLSLAGVVIYFVFRKG